MGLPLGRRKILQQAPQGTTADTGSAVVLGRKVRKGLWCKCATAFGVLGANRLIKNIQITIV